MNPVDLIAGRHKELRKAREEISKVQAALERERARLTEMQAGIAAAELRDQKALADAIVAGRAEPASEADGLRANIEQQRRRIDALVAALENAQAGVAAVVREHRSWARDQMREVEKMRVRYAAAIDELEQAREAFGVETGALAWRSTPTVGRARRSTRRWRAVTASSAAGRRFGWARCSRSCAPTWRRSTSGL